VAADTGPGPFIRPIGRVGFVFAHKIVDGWEGLNLSGSSGPALGVCDLFPGGAAEAPPEKTITP